MILCYYATTVKCKERLFGLKRNDLLTPEGTRDLLFEECAAKRTIQERFTGIFESYGYSEVITPGLEFYDLFNGKVRYYPPETMYKLVDCKNRLMVLRPDNTMPIARLAATRLKDEPLPLKLFYNQSIFMVNPKNSGRDDEFTQSGIEILGGKSCAADIEALTLAAEALAVCDEDFRLEIGESSIFPILIEQLGADDEQTENIRGFVMAKNYPALNELLSDNDSPAARAMKALPKLFGGAEVFEAAEPFMYTDELKEKLGGLKKLYSDLCACGLDGRLKVDLGLVHKKNYYTGIIFRGYVEGYGLPVLSGGRYDSLLGDFGRDLTAVGFAINIEAAAKVLLKKSGTSLVKNPDILVFGEEGAETAALKHCSDLIAQGYMVRNSLLECPKCAKKYAQEHNIKRLDIVSADGTVTTTEV